MKSIKLVFLAAVGTILTTSTYAQNYLLTVDISNPSAVVITATGNNATVDDSITDLYGGIDFLGFFTSAFANNNSISGSPIGTLMGGGTGLGYNFFDVDNASGGYVDLNPYAYYGNPESDPGADPTQNFSTTQPAFSGSMTLDLSSAIISLPAAGTSGDIQTGANSGGNSVYGNGHVGSVIGQWMVISTTPTPEPGTLALASLGGLSALILAWRRRK